MFEKVNPMHPDKIADRIAGAMVDMAYAIEENPRVAVEVLIGHGVCHIIAETSVNLDKAEVARAVHRISGVTNMIVDYKEVAQDKHLADNQEGKLRCGDNGIFIGYPRTDEETALTSIAKELYRHYGTDGKYILAGNDLIICQSHMNDDYWEIIPKIAKCFGVNSPRMVVNPLGYWEGGTDVDTGATNRKLGSDMGRAVTGGGLHGKDLSKADVSINIYAHMKAETLKKPYMFHCAIGDEKIDGLPYSSIVDGARRYITKIGGFEKFAEWGLV